MSNFTTELIAALSSGQDVTEFFRNEIETAINSILEHELTSFLDYEKWDPIGYNSGNSRNGFYGRSLKTKYGMLNLRIPRDRSGEFTQQTVTPYRQTSESLEQTIIQLYRKGITTREISDLVEKMYGHHYSAMTISNMAKLIDKDVQAFHSRMVKPNYAAIYCDATYLNVRRDTVTKEALHLLIGIDAEGYKEVLDYGLYPTESCENYKEMLQSLKKRGLGKVLLFVSDGLIGLPDAVTDVFPMAKHQSCWTHLQRNVIHKVRPADTKDIVSKLRNVYTADSRKEAEKKLEEFRTAWSSRYPKVTDAFAGKTNLFSFMDFPEEIRGSLYTNNLAESLNKRLKRVTKSKEEFPNEDALERTVCSNYIECNLKNEGRRHRGFSKVSFELQELFNLR